MRGELARTQIGFNLLRIRDMNTTTRMSLKVIHDSSRHSIRIEQNKKYLNLRENSLAILDSLISLRILITIIKIILKMKNLNQVIWNKQVVSTGVKIKFQELKNMIDTTYIWIRIKKRTQNQQIINNQQENSLESQVNLIYLPVKRTLVKLILQTFRKIMERITTKMSIHPQILDQKMQMKQMKKRKWLR